MELIDEDGFLFGVVHIIDAIFVLLLAGVVIVEDALVAPAGGESQQTTTVVVKMSPQPDSVIDPVGEPGSAEIVSVTRKHVADAEGRRRPGACGSANRERGR